MDSDREGGGCEVRTVEMVFIKPKLFSCDYNEKKQWYQVGCFEKNKS